MKDEYKQMQQTKNYYIFQTLKKSATMDIAAFKKRVEDLECEVKELRVDYDLDAHNGFKLEELRSELETIKEEEKFFLKMKLAAIDEREKYHEEEIQLIRDAKIESHIDYEELKETFDYCKLQDNLKKCWQKYYIGDKYFKSSQKERKIIIEKIHQLEIREESFQ